MALFFYIPISGKKKNKKTQTCERCILTASSIFGMVSGEKYSLFPYDGIQRGLTKAMCKSFYKQFEVLPSTFLYVICICVYIHTRWHLLLYPVPQTKRARHLQTHGLYSSHLFKVLPCEWKCKKAKTGLFFFKRHGDSDTLNWYIIPETPNKTSQSHLLDISSSTATSFSQSITSTVQAFLSHQILKMKC